MKKTLTALTMAALALAGAAVAAPAADAATYTSYGHNNQYFDRTGQITTLASGNAVARVGIELRDFGNGQVDGNVCFEILSSVIARAQIGSIKVARAVDNLAVQVTTVNANTNGASKVCASSTDVFMGSGVYSLYARTYDLSLRRTDGVLMTNGSANSYNSPRLYGCCGI